MRAEDKEELSEERREQNLTAEGIVCELGMFRALKIHVAGGVWEIIIGSELGKEESWGPAEGLQQWRATAVLQARQ